MNTICPQCRNPLDTRTGQCLKCLGGIGFSLEAETPSLGLPEATKGGAEYLLGGEYSLKEMLGEGGMGVVYRAWQQRLKRAVAIKILRGGHLSTKESRLRFLREAELAAQLQHPNIVAIHHTGEEDGVCWLAMELVKGKTLEQLMAKQRSIPTDKAAQYVEQAASAIHYAHGQRVLHRDLKPSNIMIEDTTESARILDFGIAKRLDSSEVATLTTRTGQIVGTLGYLSPEQARGQAVTAATDVYGLGAVLYHLLTGRAPFHGSNWESVLAQIGTQEIISPRRLNPNIPVSLEVICLKCLHPDASKRYQTAGELAEDLRRSSNDEPILARREPWWHRAWRWLRKRPVLASSIVAVMALLGLVVFGSMWFARWKDQNEKRTTLIAKAKEERETHAQGARTRSLAALAAAEMIRRGADIDLQRRITQAMHEATAELRVAFEPPPLDNKTMPSASADGLRYVEWRDGVIFVKEVSTDTVLWQGEHAAKDPVMQLDNQGKRVAICHAPPDINGDDNTRPSVQILSIAEKGKELFRFEHGWKINCLAWSGELLVCGGSQDLLVHVWDTQTGQRLHRFSGHDGGIQHVSFRPGGQELISRSANSDLRLWHAGLGVELLSMGGLGSCSGRASWSADGRSVYFQTENGEWDRVNFQWPAYFKVLAQGAAEVRSENMTHSVTMHPGGNLLSTVDETCVRLWSLDQGCVLATYPKTGDEWISAMLQQSQNPVCDQLWIASWNYKLRRIPITQIDSKWPVVGAAEPSQSDSGPLLAATAPRSPWVGLTNTGDKEGRCVSIVRWPSWETTKLAAKDPYCVSFSPDERWVVTGSFRKNGAEVWDLQDVNAPPRVLSFAAHVLGAGFVAEGKQLWLCGPTEIQRFDVQTWLPLGPKKNFQSRAFAIRGDGQQIALLSAKEITLNRADDLQETLRIPLPTNLGWIGNAWIKFSPDGRFLVLHGVNGVLLKVELAAMQ